MLRASKRMSNNIKGSSGVRQTRRQELETYTLTFVVIMLPRIQNVRTKPRGVLMPDLVLCVYKKGEIA